MGPRRTGVGRGVAVRATPRPTRPGSWGASTAHHLLQSSHSASSTPQAPAPRAGRSGPLPHERPAPASRAAPRPTRRESGWPVKGHATPNASRLMGHNSRSLQCCQSPPSASSTPPARAPRACQTSQAGSGLAVKASSSGQGDLDDLTRSGADRADTHVGSVFHQGHPIRRGQIAGDGLVDGCTGGDLDQRTERESLGSPLARPLFEICTAYSEPSLPNARSVMFVSPHAYFTGF